MRDKMGWIETGLALEKKGQRFYTKAAGKVKDINSRRLLDFLAREEGKHIEFFKSVREGIKGNKKIDFRKRRIKKPIFSRIAYKKITKSVSTFHIMYEALRAEELSIRLYRDAARKEKDKNLRSFLDMLAKEEHGHKELIESHKDAMYEYSYWEGLEHVPLST